MKKIIAVALLLVGMTTIAQEKRAERMSSEEQVELRVKKMKLDLDLNDKQIIEIKKLVAAQVQNREAKRAEFQAKREEEKKLREDKKFEMKSKMLDEQIAMKAEMKKILNPEQFTKWEKVQSKREEKNRDRMNKRKHDED